MRLGVAAIVTAGWLAAGSPAAWAMPVQPPAQSVVIDQIAYDTIVHRPAGQGPFPLLVIAPAKEYTMTGDLFRQLGERAAEAGYLTVRFNWRFVTARQAPSNDLSRESEDLVRVLRHFAARPDVDPSRIVLAAKSFGSRVAMREAADLVQAVLLLTPNCTVDQPFRSSYRPLLTRHRPVHIVISAQDPYAVIDQIQEAMPDLGPRAGLDLLTKGDHNFATTDTGSTANQARAIEYCMAWLKDLWPATATVR
jgi:dienelactone hydrolase